MSPEEEKEGGEEEEVKGQFPARFSDETYSRAMRAKKKKRTGTDLKMSSMSEKPLKRKKKGEKR